MPRRKTTDNHSVSFPRIGCVSIAEYSFDDGPASILKPDNFKAILHSGKNGNVNARIVRAFIESFWHWNEKVLWLLNSSSYPYKEQQEKLASMILPYLGSVVLDWGCGTGECMKRIISQFLLENPEAKLEDFPVHIFFGADIDPAALRQIIENLRNVGYHRKLGLVHSATICKSPFRNESVDVILSSLGGLMYAGWWFDNEGKFICEGRNALVNFLQDCHRVLKQGGHLGFSAPKPNPSWSWIRILSIWHLLKERRLKELSTAILHSGEAEKLSKFMHEYERRGNAHYLTIDAWNEILQQTGFEIIDQSVEEVYAKQGVVVIARKI